MARQELPLATPPLPCLKVLSLRLALWGAACVCVWLCVRAAVWVAAHVWRAAIVAAGASCLSHNPPLSAAVCWLLAELLMPPLAAPSSPPPHPPHPTPTPLLQMLAEVFITPMPLLRLMDALGARWVTAVLTPPLLPPSLLPATRGCPGSPAIASCRQLSSSHPLWCWWLYGALPILHSRPQWHIA